MIVVRMYECSAIPILKYLLQFGLFPLSLTVADVPSYKTCFLLNQEVKRCRDNNINPMSSDKGDYYRYLLALHGLLKSFELVLHFDAKLALSCLVDFKKCHASLMKGCYDDFVKQLNDIIPELYVNHLIHPKLKTLCQFLKEKYYFCEENHLHFKTLIILKRNLNTFYTSLENVLKDFMLPLSTFLVPESVLLQDSTSVFRVEDKSVFAVSASSLSKDIPWKDLTLVIEYEYDSDSMWKRMCEEQRVPHVFVKLAPLPLKTFNQIKSNHASEKSVFNQKKFTIIVSSTTPSELHLLPLLKSKGTISFYIRDYGAFLPHLYFADIVADERTAIVLTRGLSSIHSAENLYHQLSFLYLKYEMCWIIIMETRETIDVENVSKLYWSAFELCKKHATCKFKIVFAQNVREMADLIECILSNTARLSSKLKSSSTYGVTFEEEMTKEELFLVSFPSLNPFVANLMLSENRLLTPLTLDFAHLAERFPSVPERFLRCFYSSLDKEFTFPGTPQCSASNTPYSSEDDENDRPSQSSFNFSPNLQDTSEYESDGRGMDVEEVNLDVQRLCNEPYLTDSNSNDQVMEVDLRSNASSDGYKESNSYPSPSEERCLKFASLNKLNECLSNRDFSLQGLSTFSDTQRKRHNFENTIERIMSPDLVPQKSCLDVCFYPNDPLVSFKQQAKEPLKRKCTPEDPELQCLKKSCRVQKGLCSKTVTKQDLYLHSPSGGCHSREPVSEKVFSSDHPDYSHYFSPPRQHEAKRQFDPYTSASQSIPLTPRTTRRLAYEGARGQTRLVFL
ncbi:protein shortage in chiasmata 1 ortholog isoform X2 [Parasteatoda tepidariorum]|uniref:protein shortage in chiasmata 1 ortholog isoform X2 n=1 Tax=Parasteatoda tepidariorum TaxID=114398 RepID=UPI001C71858F|nr:protein shortage in chiasmata 1 ortholog-like isoform X2 [Parasteatoda tepidariorum]